MVSITRIAFTGLLALTGLTISNAASAQAIIDNLTGGSTVHESCIGSTWSRHEWDIIFPEALWGGTVLDPVVYYRVSTDHPEPISGGFTSGDDGGFLVSTEYATFFTSTTPPGTDETDRYYVFDFSGQMLDIPNDGVVWFRFIADGTESCEQWRQDIGALGTFTTTYEQNDAVRLGGTSFAVYSGGFTSPRDEPVVPVPTISSWGTLLLILGVLGFAWRRRITS
jgi:hypothetical protein